MPSEGLVNIPHMHLNPFIRLEKNKWQTLYQMIHDQHGEQRKPDQRARPLESGGFDQLYT